MIEYTDLLEYFKAEAIANALHPTEESSYRSICRSYSEKFHTPLHVVLTLDPEIVLLNHYETQMDVMDIDAKVDDLMDIIYGIEDPEYERAKEDELKSFMKEAEEEEAQRIKEGRPIHKAMAKEHSLADLPEKKELPTSGGINMSYFDESNER